MKVNIIRFLSVLALMLSGVAGSQAGILIYAGDPGVTLTGVTVVETGFESVYNSGSATPFVSSNNLVKQTGTTFASSEIGGFGSGQVQNIFYPTSDNGPDSPWLPTSNGTEYVGVMFSSAMSVSYVGFGTQYTNRSSGNYSIQYTTDNLGWTSIGTVEVASADNVLGRNLFSVGSLSNILGIRILGTPDIGLGQASVSVSELEIYSVPEPSAVALAGLTFLALFLWKRKGSSPVVG